MAESTPPAANARAEERNETVAAETDPAERFLELRAHTPARVLVGRAGPAYRTVTQLGLQADHAAAVDAVHAEVDCRRDFRPEFVERFGLFEVPTLARHRSEYLLRPDLGRQLDPAAKAEVLARCPKRADLQIVLGDGLSAVALIRQAPRVVEELAALVQQRHWSLGTVFFVRHCRVGVLNGVGEWLDPTIVVLLIGERPGLATAESLSAYMGYRPRPGHTDAERNLISNIHGNGVDPATAAQRILALADEMRRLETSGIAVKEPPSTLSASTGTVGIPLR